MTRTAMLLVPKKKHAESVLRSGWTRSGWIAGCGLALMLSLPAAARAAERITFSNGFDVVCDHYTVADGRMRVFLEQRGTDYFDVDADSVARVETVADLPLGTEPAAAVLTGSQKSVSVAHDSGPERLSAADLHPILSKAGAEHNVDVDLLASVVKAESDGHTHAVSRTGARGLMQLMPGTARQLGVANSFAAEDNVRGGTAYLDELLTRYHDNIPLALAAYNAGPQAVDRYHGIPPYRETRLYVARVVREFNRRLAARAAHARTYAATEPRTQTVASAAETGKDGVGRE